MNQDQILGIVRSILSAMCGIAIGYGLMTSEQAVQITGVAATLIPIIWSFLIHTDKAKVAAAQAVPAAQVLVSDPALASPGVQIASPAEGEHVQVKVPKS